jgi:ureidoglycolate hydrolase
VDHEGFWPAAMAESQQQQHQEFPDVMDKTDHVLDMIRAESGKTDRLLILDGVEVVRAPSPALVQIFKNQSTLWANQAVKKKARMNAGNFF